MTEQWLSIVEYARTYQVSDMTVRRRIKTGKLHAILQDGKYFIPVPGQDGRGGAGSVVVPREGAAPTQPRHSSQHSSQHLAYQQQAPRPQSMEPFAVKGHPPVQPALQGPKHSPVRALAPLDEGEGIIPNSLRRASSSEEISLVDSRALLAYCEASLRKVAEGERRTVEKFKGKLEALEAVLGQRDLEIKTLRQQGEDLQLLVKILEKRK
jgi:hypothetical protein